MLKLRLRLSRDSRENDPDGSPVRRTIGFSLASGSDAGDDNKTVNASSVEFNLHAAHKPGWEPFMDGGDYIVTIQKAPALVVPEPEPDTQSEAAPKKK